MYLQLANRTEIKKQSVKGTLDELDNILKIDTFWGPPIIISAILNKQSNRSLMVTGTLSKPCKYQVRNARYS